jgi:hypothetical protein
MPCLPRSATSGASQFCRARFAGLVADRYRHDSRRTILVRHPESVYGHSLYDQAKGEKRCGRIERFEEKVMGGVRHLDRNDSPCFRNTRCEAIYIESRAIYWAFAQDIGVDEALDFKVEAARVEEPDSLPRLGLDISICGA